MSHQIASQNEINQRITKLAHDIIVDHHSSAPLFVALLRGAAPFASKLMFAIARQAPNFHPELDYMMVSTYGVGRQAGKPRIVTDLAPTTVIDGRTVIVIDDVLDKAVTANFVIGYLRSRGAINIQLAVLATKNTQREHPIEATYSAFDSLPDGWLYGMGMDDSETAPEAYRWLEEIRQV